MKTLFSLRGRTGRLRFWRVYMSSLVLIGVFWTIGAFAVLAVGPVGAVLFLGVIPCFAAALATSLRRLHDRGRNVWWWALLMFGPFPCWAVANLLVSRGTDGATIASLPFSLGALGLAIWSWIELGFRRGEPGPNRYGDVPAIGQ